LYYISEARPFQHAEDAYDQQFGIDRIALDGYRAEAASLFGLCDQYGLNDQGPVLEIGCGTGRLSVTLAVSGRLREMLVTDPSPAFCGITARKLAALEGPLPECKIAVLAAEDVDRLPAGLFSMVILRSTLHHITDVPAFIGACSKVLPRGGLLLFEEPCHEGYVLMGAMTAIFADLLAAKSVRLTEDQARQVQLLVDTMRFYARRDVDKSRVEDKHLFRPDELMHVAREQGMDLDFFPNRTLTNIHERGRRLPAEYFEQFYFDYVKYCLSWDDALIGIFSEHVRKYFAFFEPLAEGDALPHTYGTFLARKTAG